jgi:Skp family chaperone for outer membrane proteins
MSIVLAESERWQDGVNERRRLADRMTRALEKTDQHIQLLRNERENLPPDTDERRQKEQEIRQALQEREQKRREFEAEVTQHYDNAIRALLKDLNRAVNEYAAENDVDLVLKKQSLELTDRENPQLLLATADVLYARADLDISDRIVRRLNAGYAGPIEVK